MRHVTDRELLLELDGELEFARSAAVLRHTEECELCRGRQEELARGLARAVEAQLGVAIPAAGAARERLRAALRPRYGQRALAAGALAAALALMVLPWVTGGEGDVTPRTGLTPGAVRVMDQATMCAAGEGTERAAIPHAVAMEVFRRYGIHDPRPRAYEVDYLIPPDLGGTEDERNLWPQPYNEGTWNARVKDALEDRLRTMVCEGGLALDTAQAELAGDWIGAYKRHFRTATPLPDHVAFVKDRPWE